MGGLFKKKPESKFGEGVAPYFPDPRTAPPEYFQLFQLAGGDQLGALQQALSQMPDGAVEVRLGPQSLLHCSAQNGAHSVVQFLLEQGLDKNLATSGTGVTPLLYAVQGGHPKIAATLLRVGADPNKATSSHDPRFPGLAPLHFAVISEQPQVIQALLQHGANPNQKDAGGRSPLDLAQAGGNGEVLTALQEGSATPPEDSSGPEALARLASDAGSLAAALEYVPQIEAFEGTHSQEEIGGSLVMVAVNVGSRAASAAEAEQCLAVLQRSSLGEHPGAQANFSNAMRHAASQARPAEVGYQIAQTMKKLSQFAADLEFREAYSNTLFNISVVSTSGKYCNDLAQEIATLPGFVESPTMHFNCARILSNAAGLAQNGEEARSYAEVIGKLPLYREMPQLHEASERAFRNCRRFE